jgi:transposase
MAWRRGQALGQDLRDRVLADAGRPARAVAARFGVSVSYVVKARARLRDAGEASARPQRNHIPPRLAPHHEAIRAEVARRPGATIVELRAWLAGAHGAVVGHAAMWRTLDRLGLTRKKTGPGRRAGPSGRGRGATRVGGRAAIARSGQPGVLG